MAVFHLVQHAEKERRPGDPGLTGRGRAQAARTAGRLREVGLRAIVSSPLRRARETASFLAAATGLEVREDARLRERMNWDGVQPLDAFLADWAASVRDRDRVPDSGDSSRATAARMRACLLELAEAAERAEAAEPAEGAELSARAEPFESADAEPGPIAVVTHGGATVDLLRTLIGDHAVPAALTDAGVPSCAIATLDVVPAVSGIRPAPVFSVVEIASVAHLE